MRVALDTNVLAYVEGVNGERRQLLTIELVQALVKRATLVPAQALGELYNVLVRKSGWAGEAAHAAVMAWRDAFALAPTTGASIIAATELATRHRLAIWDSLMLAVAAEGGCRLFLSEDLQHGFSWHGVTVVNPFAADRHPLLAAVLGETGRSPPPKLSSRGGKDADDKLCAIISPRPPLAGGGGARGAAGGRMARLEDLKPGAAIRGVLPGGLSPPSASPGSARRRSSLPTRTPPARSATSSSTTAASASR